jgi:hypothetical protein
VARAHAGSPHPLATRSDLLQAQAQHSRISTAPTRRPAVRGQVRTSRQHTCNPPIRIPFLSWHCRPNPSTFILPLILPCHHFRSLRRCSRHRSRLRHASQTVLSRYHRSQVVNLMSCDSRIFTWLQSPLDICPAPWIHLDRCRWCLRTSHLSHRQFDGPIGDSSLTYIHSCQF